MNRNQQGQLKDVIKQEYVRSASDPVYFLKKYCVIQHPMKGKVPFHLYNFQEKSIEDFKEENPEKYIGILVEERYKVNCDLFIEGDLNFIKV